MRIDWALAPEVLVLARRSRFSKVLLFLSEGHTGSRYSVNTRSGNAIVLPSCIKAGSLRVTGKGCILVNSGFAFFAL
jgi:hypothetical protein